GPTAPPERWGRPGGLGTPRLPRRFRTFGGCWAPWVPALLAFRMFGGSRAPSAPGSRTPGAAVVKRAGGMITR
ncbi:hypothetical protein ACWEK7_24565, partial [Streptomyces californicus]